MWWKRRTSRGALLVGVVVLLIASVAQALASHHAPPISLLALPTDATVVASADGVSDVDPAYDHKRYRYFAIQGSVHEAPQTLLADELAALHAAGWNHQIAIACPRQHPNCIRVKPTTRGANILIAAPHGGFYAALNPPVAGRAAARDQEDGTPLWGNHAIARAAAQSRPLLFGFITTGSRPSM